MKDYRLDFPLLKRKYNNQPLVYFDNAATAPKPQAVIAAVNDYYCLHNANVHRGPNFLSEEATLLYEGARKKVADFIGADKEEIIFTSGTTAGLNLLARAWGENNLKAGDIVALSRAEHHANIVPWLQLKEKLGIVLEYIDVKSDGAFDELSLDKIFEQPRLRVLSITQASNVLGQFYDLKSILARAQARGVLTIVDAAQSIAHRPLDVRFLNCDFLVFSGHKLFAPAGLGVLYGRRELLDKLPPFLGGGGMISEVKEQSFSPLADSLKLEAGTPNIEGAIALGAACDYLRGISWPEIIKREEVLVDYFFKKLEACDFVRLLGGKSGRLPLFALDLQGFHPHDAADLLGEQGIVTRAGHHCAQPLHDALEVSSSLRASLSFYNTTAEIDIFFHTLQSIKKSFSF